MSRSTLFLLGLLAGDEAAGALAIALGDDRFTGEPALIEAIRSHPMADERTLKYADRAVRKVR